MKILDVGQCGFDHSQIKRLLESRFDTRVERADSIEEALELAAESKYQLILINRIFDADGMSGLDLVRQLKQNKVTQETPVMLVSNYADAQQQAVSLGALEGFGKAELDTPQTIKRIASVIEQNS